jgi:hypothetical protein
MRRIPVAVGPTAKGVAETGCLLLLCGEALGSVETGTDWVIDE